VTKDEEGVFAEIQAGTRLSDVDGPKRPAERGWDDDADLQALGLYLVRNIVRDIKHVNISGYSYVSFRL
jgi:NCS2 family nucleobase:cation symporter-2/xanthine permease XanP